MSEVYLLIEKTYPTGTLRVKENNFEEVVFETTRGVFATKHAAVKARNILLQELPEFDNIFTELECFCSGDADAKTKLKRLDARRDKLWTTPGGHEEHTSLSNLRAELDWLAYPYKQCWRCGLNMFVHNFTVVKLSVQGE